MQIRQEINILDTTLTTNTTSGVTTSVQLDTSKYNGTVTYYFEALAKNTNVSSSRTVLLSGGVTNPSLTIPANTTSYTLFRTTFTPDSTLNEYFVNGGEASGSDVTVKAARIIIIQNATPITKTETQIEIGNESNTLTTTDTPLTNPKYWKYTAANWNGTITAYFEGVFKTGTSKSAATMTLQVADGTGDGFTGWANVTDGAVTTITTQTARVRTTTPVTLINGRWYRAVMKAGNSKSGITVSNAKIIIDSTDGAWSGADSSGNEQFIQGGTGATNFQAEAQAFKIRATSTITGVKLFLAKVGSPTDTLNVDIVSSLGGSSLANVTQSASALTTSYLEYNLTFGTPVSLTGGQTYYIQLTRSPDTADATNYILWSHTASGYSDGASQQRNSNSWASGAVDHQFTLIGQAGVTLLEPQYLLANTLFAAGTALQIFPTKWEQYRFPRLLPAQRRVRRQAVRSQLALQLRNLLRPAARRHLQAHQQRSPFPAPARLPSQLRHLAQRPVQAHRQQFLFRRVRLKALPPPNQRRQAARQLQVRQAQRKAQARVPPQRARQRVAPFRLALPQRQPVPRHRRRFPRALQAPRPARAPAQRKLLQLLLRRARVLQRVRPQLRQALRSHSPPRLLFPLRQAPRQRLARLRRHNRPAPLRVSQRVLRRPRPAAPRVPQNQPRRVLQYLPAPPRPQLPARRLPRFRPQQAPRRPARRLRRPYL